MEENRKILNSMSYIEKSAFIFLTQLGFKRNRVLAAVFFFFAFEFANVHTDH